MAVKRLNQTSGYNLFNVSCIVLGIFILVLGLIMTVLAFVIQNDVWFGSSGLLIFFIGLLLAVAGFLVS